MYDIKNCQAAIWPIRLLEINMRYNKNTMILDYFTLSCTISKVQYRLLRQITETYNLFSSVIMISTMCKTTVMFDYFNVHINPNLSLAQLYFLECVNRNNVKEKYAENSAKFWKKKTFQKSRGPKP